jgi:hypothetical protein
MFKVPATHIHMNRLNRLILRGGLLRTMQPQTMNAVNIVLRRSPAWKWAYVAVNEELMKPIYYLNKKDTAFNYVEIQWEPYLEEPQITVNNLILPQQPTVLRNFQIVVKLSDNDLSHYASFI